MISLAGKLVGHTGDIRAIAPHWLSDLFATGCFDYRHTHNEIILWQLSTGKQIGVLHTDLLGISALAVSPEGRYLAAAGGALCIGNEWQHSPGIEIWDLEKRCHAVTIARDIFHAKYLEFSTDGSLLFVGNPQRPIAESKHPMPGISIFATRGWKKIASTAMGADCTAGSFFAGREKLIYATWSDDVVTINSREHRGINFTRSDFMEAVRTAQEVRPKDFIHIFDVRSGREEQSIQVRTSYVKAIACCPEMGLFATSGKELVLWSLEDRTLFKELRAPNTSDTNCISLSYRHKRAASGTGFKFDAGSPYQECGINLFGLPDGEFRESAVTQSPVRSIALSEDGRKCISGGERGELCIWDLSD